MYVSRPESVCRRCCRRSIANKCRWISRIDLIPSSNFRDNLIIAMSSAQIDADGFVSDIIGDTFGYLGCSAESVCDAEQAIEYIDPKLLDYQPTATSAFPSQNLTVKELGIVAWSDPWHISGWEVTEAFAKKWEFLFKGCDEIVVVSNQWRSARGEDPLILEI